ncbi:MAG: hypothetical protein ABH869_04390, partial [Candidatus Omnitrophota bacterium]
DTSAEIAGIVGDETGSGNLVFSASPTFTGDVTMPGTGVWKSAGNVGIGTASPTATLNIDENDEQYALLVKGGAGGQALGKFQRDVGGDGIVQITASSNDPQIDFDPEDSGQAWAIGIDDGLSDMFRITPAVNIESAGASGITITAAGNVGIGTTNPTQKFEVDGSIKLAGRIRQGSLGDLAEMMAFSACVMNPVTEPLAMPAVLVHGANEELPVFLKDKQTYTEYLYAQPSAGDVVVIDETGGIRRSYEAFSTNVVGIISTNPAQILMEDLENAAPLALSGVVPCKVTTENGAIKPGDLLVASSLPAHAMKAGDNPPAGSVIGKALGRLDKDEGADDEVGVISVIVMMQ